ncbi:Lsr2 family protein [Paeniglutamicibacter sp. ABSL32-1]|uniref:histone-like nucleoid-structuring protein Lsr2 n=1 Tax=Paeniglutamicibacter quisquiliarum TaxID=2849498 RepID=UPI001C2DDD3B|nr:Lsr2 family protein [Paeniglutamicibacter quisquiliarum]MBV1778662.1 Lsr2 family protein [Paeniglutamicibacter quisquiliarum]
MAKHTITIDDIDGSKEAKSYRFGLGNDEYTIDLSADNYKALQEALAPFIKAGAKVVASVPRSSNGVRNSPEELQKVREWAAANGYDVAPRGRVKQSIMDAYAESNQS